MILLFREGVSRFFHNIGLPFLVAFPEYDFIVDVSYRGAMSLRANNQVSVSQISKEWADGGGHPNAAGGRIHGFKEQYRYDKVKQQILSVIDKAESKKIPVIIYAKQGEIKNLEHWEIFNGYIFCDVANTPNRLVIILLNILKIV